jgi:phosphoglycerate dehydrogenase-like enzyme
LQWRALRSLTHLWLEAPVSDAVLAQLPAGVQVMRATAQPPIYSNATPAQAIIASSQLRYDATVLDACPHLRLIARTGIGVDNIDLDAATARGVVVTNTPDGPTESTAEHTVAMLLALAKRLKQGNDNLAAGQWGPRTGVIVGDEVQGKTLGLIGFGRIGRRVAEICRLAFQMRVLAYDPYLTVESVAALGVTPAPLDAVITQADFLSLHVPATPATIGLMNADRLAQMKPGSYLLNLARGPLVDEAALLAALDAATSPAPGSMSLLPSRPRSTTRCAAIPPSSPHRTAPPSRAKGAAAWRRWRWRACWPSSAARAPPTSPTRQRGQANSSKFVQFVTPLSSHGVRNRPSITARSWPGICHATLRLSF